MSRKSSSKNASTTTNNQRQIQLSSGGDNNGIVVGAGGDTTVSVLDGGAIEEAFSFSSGALDVVEGVLVNALNLVGKDRSQEYQQQRDALIELSDRSRTETAQSLSEFSKYFFGTLALLGVAGAVAYGVKK